MNSRRYWSNYTRAATRVPSGTRARDRSTRELERVEEQVGNVSLDDGVFVRASAQAKKFAIVTNVNVCVDEETKEKIEGLGGTIIDYTRDNPSALKDATVLVVDASSIEPWTTPFLYCLIKGIHIVTLEWLHESVNSEPGKFLSPEKFLLMEHENAKSYVTQEAPEEAHVEPATLRQVIALGIANKSEGNGFLNGYSVILCPGVGEEKEALVTGGEREAVLTREELNLLLPAAGAKVLEVIRDENIGADKLFSVTSTPSTKDQKIYATRMVGSYVTSYCMVRVIFEQNAALLKRAIEGKEGRVANMIAAEEENFHLLFQTKLRRVSRTLSNLNEGNPDRAELGAGGKLHLVKDDDGKKFVLYFDKEGVLKFKAPFAKASSKLGNSGRQHTVVWDAVNDADPQGHFRRFFFWFANREQLDTFLVSLYGIEPLPTTDQSILEEWYDEDGRFIHQGSTKPHHDVVGNDDQMEIDSAAHQRRATTPRAAVMAEHGYAALLASGIPN